MLLQKVKIKIQNDVIVHQSASLSVNEDVRINFKQSYQCLHALKCQKCAIKKIDRKILMLTPGPLDRKILMLVQKVLQISFFGRSLSSRVFGSIYGHIYCFGSSSLQVFKLKSRRKQKVNEVLAPGPLSAIVRNSFFDRSIVFKSGLQVFRSSSLQVKESGFQVKKLS